MWTPLLTLSFLGSISSGRATCLLDNKISLRACAKKCMDAEDPVVCISDCLKGDGVPNTCADCLGTEFDCGRRFCGVSCHLNPKASSCRDCLHSQCSVCSTALDFEAHSSGMEAELADTVELAKEPTGDVTSALTTFAKRAGSCASSQALLSSCGTPCYSSGDPSGCYAKCAMRACFSGCYDCSTTHCFESCRRSFSSFECATCVSGFCGGCGVRPGLQQFENATILP